MRATCHDHQNIYCQFAALQAIFEVLTFFVVISYCVLETRPQSCPSLLSRVQVQLESKFRPFFSADLIAATLTVTLSTKDARVACLQ